MHLGQDEGDVGQTASHSDGRPLESADNEHHSLAGYGDLQGTNTTYGQQSHKACMQVG